MPARGWSDRGSFHKPSKAGGPQQLNKTVKWTQPLHLQKEPAQQTP